MVMVVVPVIFLLDMWIILMYYYIRIISYMLASINHQSCLFFLPLAQQAALLKDDLLDPVDLLLDDEELKLGEGFSVDMVAMRRTFISIVLNVWVRECC